MFPRLTDAEIARLSKFGEPCGFNAGEVVAKVGEAGRGLLLIASGKVEVTRHERDRSEYIVTHERGNFMGELAQLSGRPYLVDALALTDVEAFAIAPDRLRALLIAEADLGERIMRALILRRVGLIEAGAGPVIVGDEANADVLRLINFLRRNGHPYQNLDPATDGCAQTLIERFRVAPEELPIVLCPNGNLLRNPSEDQIARCVGLVGPIDANRLYDVVIIGSGPAGLATAVYAGSEGLSVLAVDCRSFGGQAGASARIENYLGFPTGISGMALMGRAFSQAQKFGVEIAIPDEAVKLECGNDPCHIAPRHRRAHPGAHHRARDRRPLPPARGRPARGIRRLVGPLLGLAARSRPRRGPGCRAGRRRQQRRPSHGLPRQPGAPRHPRRPPPA